MIGFGQGPAVAKIHPGSMSCQPSFAGHRQKPVSHAEWEVRSVVKDKMHENIGLWTYKQAILGLGTFQKAKRCFVAGMCTCFPAGTKTLCQG